MGSELNLMQRKQGEKTNEVELGESEGTPVNVLKRSIVPVYWIQVYPLIGNFVPRGSWFLSKNDTFYHLRFLGKSVQKRAFWVF